MLLLLYLDVVFFLLVLSLFTKKTYQSIFLNTFLIPRPKLIPYLNQIYFCLVPTLPLLFFNNLFRI